MHDIKTDDKNRVTESLIDQTIFEIKFHTFENTTTTICCLTLKNGFEVVGYSSPLNPKNYNKPLAEKIALEHAKKKIYGLEAYLLKQEISNKQ